MKPIFLLIAVIFSFQICLFAQPTNRIAKKLNTKSEDIISATLQTSKTEHLNNSERAFTSKKVLENGYVLVSKLGQYWNGNDWENSSLISFTYTQDGLETEEVDQYWNNGEWENSSRFITTYYLNGDIYTYEQQTWNGTGWVNSYRYESLYSADNKLSEYNVYQWDGSVWSNMHKTIYTYYTTGNLETIIEQQWDGAIWLNTYKYLYQYNSNNNVTEKLSEEWIEGSWKNAYKDIYSYNPQELVELIEFYWWFDTFWKESVEIYYEYDIMGNLTDRLTKFWESEILGLQNKYHTSYEYIPATSVETKVENQEWDLQVMQWINTYRDVKTYNENNVIQKYTTDVWNGSTWFSTNQENYTYDSNGNLDILLAQYWSGTGWINTFREYHNWTLITDMDSENLSSHPFTYSLEQNYPNPFNPSTKISWYLPASSQVTLKVYDLLGNEVATLVDEHREAGIYKVEFNASALSSGVYMYRIQAGDYVAVKKMLLLK